MSRLICFAATLMSCLATSAHAIFITYDQRQNLNVLNSPEVTITANFYQADNNDAGGALRGGFGFETSNSGVGWFSGAIPSGQNEVFTINLGRPRNVETFHLNGPRNILSAIIETSPNGTSWAPMTHGTTVSGNDTTFVLNQPVTTKWLRLTGQGYAEPSPTVGIYTMRVYGAAGTLRADPGTDLVSSSGWTAGGVTISTIGGNLSPATALADIANDRPAAISRQLIYDLGSGDSVTATFAQVVESVGRVGFVIGKTGSPFDTNMHFRMLGSTDGAT